MEKMEKFVNMSADDLKVVGETARLMATAIGAAGGAAMVFATGIPAAGTMYGLEGLAGGFAGCAAGAIAGTALKHCMIKKVNQAKKSITEKKLKQGMENYFDMFNELVPDASAKDAVIAKLLGDELHDAAQNNRPVDTEEVLKAICAQNKCDFEAMNRHVSANRCNYNNTNNNSDVNIAIDGINTALTEHHRNLQFVPPATIHEQLKQKREAIEIMRIEAEKRRDYEAMVARY